MFAKDNGGPIRGARQRKEADDNLDKENNTDEEEMMFCDCCPAYKLSDEVGENLVEEEYPVPDEMVGLIIGRGGENIKRLLSETGCRVQMAPKCNEDSTRHCIISGSQKSVEVVKSMIREIISRYKSEHFIMQMMIPGPKVGRLIGKGGENLRSLQEKCGVKMAVIQDSPEPTMHEKPLRITGDQENVEFAEHVVKDFLAGMDPKFRPRVFVSSPVYREDIIREKNRSKSFSSTVPEKDAPLRNQEKSYSDISTFKPLVNDNLPCAQEQKDNFFARAVIWVIIAFVLKCILF